MKSTYKTTNGTSVSLTEKQETFVQKALEMFPEIKESGTISRKQAFEVYAACNAGHPKWLKNLKLQATRGNYFLPVTCVSKKDKGPEKQKEKSTSKKSDTKVAEAGSSSQSTAVEDLEKELVANGIEV